MLIVGIILLGIMTQVVIQWVGGRTNNTIDWSEIPISLVDWGNK
jgi:hypothetical protein